MGIMHGSLGVVKRAGHHADEGDGDFIQCQVAFVVPLGLFQAIHTFIIQHIRIGAAQSCGFVGSVEVDKQVVFGGHGRHTVVEVDNLLVIAIHKVDLEAFHAHLGIMLAHMLHVLVDGGIAGPKHDAHVTFSAIVDQLLQIDLRHHLEEIGLLVHRPTFVQNHIFDAISRGEVDVIFIGIVVDASLERHAVDVPVVPPVPGHLAGLDPAEIFYAAGRGEFIDQVAVSQILVVFGDHDATPRKAALAFHFGDVVLSFLHHILQVVVATLLLHFGIAGMNRSKAIQTFFISKQQPWKILQIGLGNHGFLAVFQLHQSRQKHQPFGFHLAQRRDGVGVFE